VETKVCSKCKSELPIAQFRKNRSNKDGLQKYCKSCHSAACNRYKVDNAGKIKETNSRYYREHAESLRVNSRLYYQNNADKHKELTSNWKINNKEKNAQLVRDWKIANKARSNEIDREYQRRRKQDPVLKLTDNIRALICNCINNGGYAKTTKTAEILGIDFESFYIHLLQTFVYNYGRSYNPEIDVVHIDHIVPISTATNEEEVIKLNHYTNLQWLLATDNLKKGDKLDFVIPPQ